MRVVTPWPCTIRQLQLMSQTVLAPPPPRLTASSPLPQKPCLDGTPGTTCRAILPLATGFWLVATIQ